MRGSVKKWIPTDPDDLCLITGRLFPKNEGMSLDKFFSDLIKRAEESEEIDNGGTDAEGFYKPTRTILLRHLNLLKDLHQKPLAKTMVKASWAYVVEHVPPEWLVPATAEERAELKRVLG